MQSDVELGFTPSVGCTNFNNFVSPQVGTTGCANNVDTRSLAQDTYAANLPQWWTDFAAAWQNMTEFGYTLTAAGTLSR